MKALKNLIDAKQLSKKEQQAVKGGGPITCYVMCPVDHGCIGTTCFYVGR